MDDGRLLQSGTYYEEIYTLEVLSCFTCRPNSQCINVQKITVTDCKFLGIFVDKSIQTTSSSKNQLCQTIKEIQKPVGTFLNW